VNTSMGADLRPKSEDARKQYYPTFTFSLEEEQSPSLMVLVVAVEREVSLGHWDSWIRFKGGGRDRFAKPSNSAGEHEIFIFEDSGL
jgi:hypothetical protein